MKAGTTVFTERLFMSVSFFVFFFYYTLLPEVNPSNCYVFSSQCVNKDP